MTKYFLCFESLDSPGCPLVVHCAVCGPNPDVYGTGRQFANKQEALKALESAGLPDYQMDKLEQILKLGNSSFIGVSKEECLKLGVLHIP